MKNFLMILFTAIYFVCFFFLLDFIFRRLPLHSFIDILTLVCLFVAFLASVGLAQFTIHKLLSRSDK